MTNPAFALMAIQQSAMVEAVGMAKTMAECMFRIAEAQHRLFLHAIHPAFDFDRRDDHPAYHPDGPALDDHYGKRNHDIDVEHDL